MTLAGSRAALVHALPFASCYVYSPSASDAVSARSRLFCTLLKEGDARFLAKCAARVRREALASPTLGDFFPCAGLLVPVPGSVPGYRGSPWIAARVAEALAHAGLGGGVRSALARSSRVRKSATAPSGSRPTIAQHYESMAWMLDAGAPDDIVLVDDVVTKGRTMLAAANRVRASLPHARIRGFALMRTMGFSTAIDCVLDPCVGEIRQRRGEAHRSP